MVLRDEVIRCLADGKPHSGADLAARLGVSRTAVWNHVRCLTELGLEVRATRGRGYHLLHPVELLDRERILAALDPVVAGSVSDLQVLSVTDSTSERLAAMPPAPTGYFHACFAEFQTGGRGRRGRAWVSPYGAGLCLSVSATLERPPPGLQALSMAIAVAVCRSLLGTGVPGITVKWPNDIMSGDGKLAGILVDVAGESAGPLRVVAGIGLNMQTSPQVIHAVREAGGLPPAGLDSVAGARGRNEVAALVLQALCTGLRDFEVAGFAPFEPDWRRFDYLNGRPVTVAIGTGMQAGIARGIALDGALLLETADGVRGVYAGEVSVRAAR